MDFLLHRRVVDRSYGAIIMKFPAQALRCLGSRYYHSLHLGSVTEATIQAMKNNHYAIWKPRSRPLEERDYCIPKSTISTINANQP